jgi:hypothetical protein
VLAVDLCGRCLRFPSLGLNGPAPAGINPRGLRHLPVAIAGTGGVLAASMIRDGCAEDFAGPAFRSPAGGRESLTRRVGAIVHVLIMQVPIVQVLMVQMLMVQMLMVQVLIVQA